MNSIQNQIDEVQLQLATELAKGISANAEEISRLKKQQRKLEEQLRQEASEQERAARTEQYEAINGEYIETLSSMFEALFPKESYVTAWGLNVYSEKRQDFYKMNKAYFSENTRLITQVYEDEIASKDAKIKALTEQGMRTEDQLTELRGELEECKVKLAGAQEELDSALHELDDEKCAHAEAVNLLNETKARLNDAEKIIEQGKVANAELIRENGNLREHTAKLNEQAEAAKKVKEANKPTESLQQLMNEVRSKNMMSQSVADKAARALARWNADNPDLSVTPIEIPTVNPVEAGGQFRPDPAAEPQDDRIPAAQESVTPPEVQFPEVGLAEAASSADADSKGKDIWQVVAALERRVAAIEDRFVSETVEEPEPKLLQM